MRHICVKTAHIHFEKDATIIADCISRVLEINKKLPENEKIRVISISMGFGEADVGYEELVKMIDKAKLENILVITVENIGNSGFKFAGMGREYLADPDNPSSYLPADWDAEAFYNGQNMRAGQLLVPMGSRTYASCTGTSNYEIASAGGMSWAVPWLAGFYALCCQVKPDITQKEFIEVAKATATKTEITHNGKKYYLGLVINPAATIEELQSRA